MAASAGREMESRSREVDRAGRRIVAISRGLRPKTAFTIQQVEQSLERMQATRASLANDLETARAAMAAARGEMKEKSDLTRRAKETEVILLKAKTDGPKWVRRVRGSFRRMVDQEKNLLLSELKLPKDILDPASYRAFEAWQRGVRGIPSEHWIPEDHGARVVLEKTMGPCSAKGWDLTELGKVLVNLSINAARNSDAENRADQHNPVQSTRPSELEQELSPSNRELAKQVRNLQARLHKPGKGGLKPTDAEARDASAIRQQTGGLSRRNQGLENQCRDLQTRLSEAEKEKQETMEVHARDISVAQREMARLREQDTAWQKAVEGAIGSGRDLAWALFTVASGDVGTLKPSVLKPLLPVDEDGKPLVDSEMEEFEWPTAEEALRVADIFRLSVAGRLPPKTSLLQYLLPVLRQPTTLTASDAVFLQSLLPGRRLPQVEVVVMTATLRAVLLADVDDLSFVVTACILSQQQLSSPFAFYPRIVEEIATTKVEPSFLVHAALLRMVKAGVNTSPELSTLLIDSRSHRTFPRARQQHQSL